MADRVPYQSNGRGGGGLPGVQVASGAGLLSYVGKAVQETIGQAQTYRDTLQRQMVQQAVTEGNMRLAEYAAEHEADPTGFLKKSSEYRKSVARTYGDPIVSATVDRQLDITQREYGIRIRDNFNGVEADRMRGSDMAYMNEQLRYFAEHGIDENTMPQLVEFTQNVAQMRGGTGPSGLPLYDPAAFDQKAINIYQGIAENYIKGIIHDSNGMLGDQPMSEFIRSNKLSVDFVDLQTGEVGPMNLRKVFPDAGDIESLASYADAELARSNRQNKEYLSQQYFDLKHKYDDATAIAKTGQEIPPELDFTQEEWMILGEGDPDKTNKLADDLNEEIKSGVARSAGLKDPNEIGINDEAYKNLDARFKADYLSGSETARNQMAAHSVEYFMSNDVDEGVSKSYKSAVDAIMTGHHDMAAKFFDEYSNGLSQLRSRYGAPDDHIFRPSDAKQIAGLVANAQAPEGTSPARAKAAVLQSLQGVFKGDSGIAFRDIFGDGTLDDRLLVVSDLGETGVGVDAINAIDAGPELDAALGSQKKTLDEMVDKNDSINNFLSSFPSNGFDIRQAAAWKRMVRDVAGLYVTQGMSPKKAVESATASIIRQRYSESALSEGVRLPKAFVGAYPGIDESTIVRGLSDLSFQKMIDDYETDIDGSMIEGGFDAVSQLRSDGRLITNADETGVILVYKSGQPAYTKDGNVIDLKWPAVQQYGQQVPLIQQDIGYKALGSFESVSGEPATGQAPGAEFAQDAAEGLGIALNFGKNPNAYKDYKKSGRLNPAREKRITGKR